MGLGILLLGIVIPKAAAFVSGKPPTLLASFSLFGNAKGVGASLMLADVQSPQSRSILLNGSTSSLNGLPPDAVIERVYLFWTGSLAETGLAGPKSADTQVTFSVADGSTFNVNASAGGCSTAVNPTDPNFPPFYYCRADVTSQVAAHPFAGSYNGVYRLGDVDASPAVFTNVGGNRVCQTNYCQAKYAAWSMVVVWSAASETVNRDIRLYDGFIVLDHVDGPGGSLGVTSFNISNFLADSNPQARLTFFAVEGDDRLGQPPQNLLPPSDRSFCTVCQDSVTFNGTKLVDTSGNPDNIFNESLDSGNNSGVDIDSIDVSALVAPGSTSATIQLNSGTGPVDPTDPTHGGGELFGYGWTLLALSRPAPNFKSGQTSKTVNPTTAGQGETLAYNVTIANTGSAVATNTRVTDTLPANLTYTPGSLQIGGVPCTDAADADACTVTGNTLTVNLGALTYLPPGNSRQIGFLARLGAGATNGQVLCNTAQVVSDQTPAPHTTPQACVTVQAPQLDTPTKVDIDLDGGLAEPDDIIQYTVLVRKQSSGQASAIRFVDDMPRHLKLLSVIAPPGSINNSNNAGGVNGTGRVDISDIVIPANLSSVAVTILAQVDTEAEFVAKGVPANSIDGFNICNQGEVTAPFFTGSLLTDDPATTGGSNPTCFSLTYRPNLSTSGKSVADVNGGLVEPGDQLRYTITLANTGNRPATVSLTDDLPAFVGGFALVAPVPGAAFSPPPAGANGTGRLIVTSLPLPAGSTRTIEFTVNVSATAPDKTGVQNCTPFTVPERPAENRTICSPRLEVFARPDLNQSDKTVVDGNGGDVNPGDTLTYTLTLRNTGNRPATTVVLRDVVAASLTNVLPLDGGTFDAPSRTLTWNIGAIAAGATITRRFTAQPVTPLPNGTQICNQGIVASAELPDEPTDDPATPVANDATCVRVVSAPDFSTTTKSVLDLNGAPVRPGDVLRYTITVRNSGTETATNLQVRDLVSIFLNNVVPADGGVFTAATRTINWTVASLAPGAQAVLHFDAQIVTPLTNGTVIDNQGFVTATQVPAPGTPTDDPTTPAVGDATRVTVTSSANLGTSTKAVLDDNGGAAQPGDLLRYTITVRNSGDASARQTAVSDVVDARLTNVTPLDGGVFVAATRTITWPPANVLPGVDRVLRFSAQLLFPLANGSVVCNQGSISSTDVTGTILTDDPATPAAGDSTCVTVQSAPDLGASTKTVMDVNGGQVEPGDVLRYTVNVDNVGTEDATTVVVRDTVATTLTNVTPLDGGVFNAATRTITWTLPTVGAKTQRPLRFDATIVTPLDNGTTIANQARIDAAGLTQVLTDDPSTAATDDPTVVTVTSTPDFSGTTKTVTDQNGGLVEPGDLLTYTIVVRNTGKSEADNVVISDVLDANVDFVSATAGGVFDAPSRTLRWTATTTPALLKLGLSPATTVTLSFVARAKNPLANGTQLCNQAQLVSDEVTVAQRTDNPATPAVGDPTCVTVSSAPDLSGATKTVVDNNGGDVRPGDTLTWAITLTNTGNEPATNLVVSDVVDANLQTITPAQGGAFNAANRTISWTAATTPALASLAPSASVVLTFTAVVVKPLADGTVIANQARITASNLGTPVLTDNPATPALDDATQVTVRAESNVTTSTKIVTDTNGGDPEPGDLLQYTITLKNSGDALAQNVSVTDVVDANLQNIVVLDGGAFNAATRTISWTVPQLGLTPAGDLTLRFNARIVTPLKNGTVISNQADITVAGGVTVKTDDPATPAVDDATRLTVVSKPDLSTMTKDVAGATANRTVAPNAILTYTIRVPNTGSEDALNVLVLDKVSDQLTDIQPLDGGSFNSATRDVSWTIAELKGSQVRSLRFRARVRPDVKNGVVIDNQAFAELAGVAGSKVPSDDPQTPVLDDPTRVTVVAIADLERFEKSVVDSNGGDVEPGDTLTYTLTVRNDGTAFAFNLGVRDTVDADLEAVTPGQGGTFNVATRTIAWTATTTPALAQLAPNDTVTLTFTARVRVPTANGTTVRNQAFLTADGLNTEPSDDPSTPQNDDPTDVKIVAEPRLGTSTKTVVDLNGGRVAPNDQLEYRIRVINTGSANASDVRVVDAIPAYTSYVAGSTLLNGQAVGDAAGGTSPLGNGIRVNSPGQPSGVVTVGDGAAAEVRFRVRVRSDVIEGRIISNQGLVRSNEVPLAFTDDPSTAPVGDPTQVVVGAGPNLNVTTKTFSPQPVGDNGNGRFDVGEQIAYTVTIRNTGTAAATNVVFTDPIDPARGIFAGSTLGLNGQQLTEVADGDAGSVSNNLLRVVVGSIAAGAAATITYRVRILAGPLVVNQGTVRSRELQPVLTDNDGNDGNGDAATVVSVGAGTRGVIATKAVQDVNGGSVEAGDELLYTITLFNQGSGDERIDIVDNLPDKTRLVAGSLLAPPGSNTRIEAPPVGANGRGRITVSGYTLGAGQSVTIALRLRVDGDAAAGSSVCNRVNVSATGGLDVRASEPACVLIGSPLGTGGLSGTVFRDLGVDNRLLESGDQKLAGLQLQAFYFGDPNATPAATAVSDGEGRYTLGKLPPGPYTLRILTGRGTELGTLAAVTVPRGQAVTRDVPVDPTGIIYNAVTGDALANVRATLYFDAKDALAPGQKVPGALLGQGQQDQQTDGSGFYRFDAPVGRRYRIELTALSSSLQAPSSLVPASDGLAQVGAEQEVVPDDVPNPQREGANLTHYLRFERSKQSDALFNNHLPVDPLSSLIKLKKRADRMRAGLGDLVSYTISVENRSTRDFLAANERVSIEDLLPRGLRFLRGTVRRIRRLRPGGSCVAPEVERKDTDGSRACLDRSAPVTSKTGRLLRFGPFPLGSGEAVRLIYQLAIGLDSKPGVYENLAVLKDRGLASELSNRDVARLTVLPDPDLDQGLLLGKVFCDKNGDGRQQGGEHGVAGARIYLDNGNLGITDRYGKYHLRGIDPGLRLVKIDVDSLRPGSKLSTAESRVIHFTRGLPARVSFGVRCVDNWVGVQQLIKAKKKGKTAPKKATKRKPLVPVLELAGDARALSLSSDGQPVPLLDADLLIAGGRLAADAAKDWRHAKAPNLPAPKAGRSRMVFNLRAQGRPGQGWRLTILQLSARGRRLLRRFSGAGAPPAQLVWDGRLGGKLLLRAGGVYAARLDVLSTDAAGGASPLRVFGVAASSLPAVPERAPGVRFDGRPLLLDAKGRFSASVGRAREKPLLIELSREDGKRAWVTLGPLPAVDDEEPPERLLVEGNLESGRLLVEGKVIDTTLLRTTLAPGSAAPQPANKPMTSTLPVGVDRRGRPRLPVVFAPGSASTLVQSWRLRLSDAKGRLVRTLGGSGSLPSSLAWDGRDTAGKLALEAGTRLLARLTVFDARGNIGQSAPLTVAVAPRLGLRALELRGRRLFSPRSGSLLAGFSRQLVATLRRVRGRPAEERYELDARLAPPIAGQSTRWKLALDRARADLLRLLRRSGLEGRVELRVNAVPLPAQALVPKAKKYRRTARRADPRRESLRFAPLPLPTLVATRPRARVRVDGESVALEKNATFRVRAKVQLGSAVVIELHDARGASTVLLVPTAPKAKLPTSRRLPGFAPQRVAGTTQRGSTLQQLLRMRGGATLELHLAQATASKSTSQSTSKPTSQSTSKPTSKPLAKPARVPTPPAKAPPVVVPPADPWLALDRRLAGFGQAELQRAFKQTLVPTTAPTSRKVVPIGAAELQVDLPPRGAVLRSHQLSLRGKTHAKNIVTINGQKVRVDQDGRFAHTVKLPDGASELKIRAQDPAGNVGLIRWPVRVSDSSFFLMAMAEGAIGQAGVELPEDNDQSRLSSDALLLRGRAVLYLKARIKGKYLFSRYLITAHVDTAKKRELEEFFDQVIDPNRYYPIYGDSSLHVRDVNARDKYYVMVQADDSSLRVGNFRAGIKGISLLRYDRVLYGAKVDLKKSLAKARVKTRLQAFYSRDDARRARDLNMLRATGGSIYYLRHGQVLEGTEQIRVVVRERDTGLELASVPMTRDTDYRIDYAGGRLLFSAPVPSVADAGFAASNPGMTVSTLAGHPVFIEINYEYETAEDQGKNAWGVQGKTTLFDILTVGGTYVSEERAAGLGGDYRLYGAEMTVRHGKATQLSAEFARSESYNLNNFLSEDGGITYLSLNSVAGISADQRASDSNAYLLRATVEASDFFKRLEAGKLRGQAYYDRKERGFYSGGTILDQGRTRYGGRIDWRVAKGHDLTLRHDGAVALLPQLPVLGNQQLDPLMMREIQQELTRLSYKMQSGRFKLASEYTHLYMTDPTTTGGSSNRDTIGVLAGYRVNKWLSLSLGQDAIVYASGHDPQYGTGTQIGLATSFAGDWRDRFLTTFGAEVKLTKWLSVQVLESLRWSGDNATAFGLKTAISKHASMYVRQVLGTVDEKFNSMTVVGAEDRFGPKLGGRTYGEYQLDTGVAGRRNRAVLGLVHKWTPWRGIAFSGGFEHQQVFGARLPDGTPMGDMQRDVLHAGFEFLRIKNLKLSTRAELRYDSATGVTGLGPEGFSQKFTGIDPKNTLNASNVDPRAGFGSGTYGDRSLNPGNQLNVTPGERWQLLTRNHVAWALSKDLTLLGRANYYRTYNRTEEMLEAEALELGFGAALRPINFDWLDILFKYTRILELRPISLTDDLARRRTYDVLSLAAIVELPLGLQLVEKIAYKRVDEQLDVLADETISTVLHTLLWINRINLHVIGHLDAGVEYRLLRMFIESQGDQLQHGLLLEAGYWVHRFVRLGVGYNFTRFSDNEFADQSRDASGFFFRVVGRY